MRKRQKANLALGISAAGFVVTLPTIGLGNMGFWNGILHHGFLAATIGGLADWFAVTAIFHKPLGISYRTDILRRNRSRLTDALVSYASEDLLSVDHIMEVVRQQDGAHLLEDYLTKRGGGDLLKRTAKGILTRASEEIDTEKISEMLSPVLEQRLDDLSLSGSLQQIFQRLASERNMDKLLEDVFLFTDRLIDSKECFNLLYEQVRIFRQAYEGDSEGRAFLLAVTGLTDEKITLLLKKSLHEGIDSLRSTNSPAYVKLRSVVRQKLLEILEDQYTWQIFSEGKKAILSSLNLQDALASYIKENFKGDHPIWEKPLDDFIDRKIEAFIQREPLRRRFNQKAMDFIEQELREHHAVIADLIRERINEFSDDALIDFVENKVEDDLQMIRINGAIVGSLVGMGLFLLVYLAERMNCF